VAETDSPCHAQAPASVVIIGAVPKVAPTLAKIEAEIDAALREHHDALVQLLARALISLAVQEHYDKTRGERHNSGPRLCADCRVNLAAERRTICHSCRRRRRNEQARLRRAAFAEEQAARNGYRGERARELATGARVDPARGLIGA
jgi:hypothetical protein